MKFNEALGATGLSLRRRFLCSLIALALATAIWLPLLQFLFHPRLEEYLSTGLVAPRAKALAARHLELWTDPRMRAEEVNKMRSSNAEWDFMGRTFFVLALANMAMRDRDQEKNYLEVMDRIILETRRLEMERGFTFFLLDYARASPFLQKPPRSLFVDGEIALMLGVRRLVEERKDYQAVFGHLVSTIHTRMKAAPVLCSESYPDECWTFCNTVALAALRISDALDKTDHSQFFRDWISTARRKLIDPGTGLLVSSFSLNGMVQDGPEGSTIWMAAHCLQLIDEEFARDQYRRAKRELARTLFGFGYAREWPPSYLGPVDIDSGPVIPLLGASPSSSGLAIMGSSAFGDREYVSTLCASLNLSAFPLEKNGRLKYCASNQVGDAVLLYAMVLGPVWQSVKERTGT